MRVWFHIPLSGAILAALAASPIAAADPQQQGVAPRVKVATAARPANAPRQAPRRPFVALAPGVGFGDEASMMSSGPFDGIGGIEPSPLVPRPAVLPRLADDCPTAEQTEAGVTILRGRGSQRPTAEQTAEGVTVLRGPSAYGPVR